MENEIKVTTTDTTYCISDIDFLQVGAMQGWQCPICKRVLAPFVQECPCRGQGMQTVTTATIERRSE